MAKLICTLSDTERHAQELQWSDLAGRALSRTEVPGGVVSTYPLALAERVEDLAARELGCCGSWMKIQVERVDRVVWLSVTAQNDDGVEVIRNFLRRGTADGLVN